MSNRLLNFLSLLAAIVLLQEVSLIEANLSGTAGFTTYTSYAPCCPGYASYDPKADTTECTQFSACDYVGGFAALSNQMTLDWVKSHNIVSFYDNSDPSGKNWATKYANKTVRLTKNGKTFDAVIYDTCGNSDCDGCCAQNSISGYLVDMEYYTVLRNFNNDINQADGTINFQIIDQATITTTTKK